MTQVERLSSRDTKIALRSVRIAACSCGRGKRACMVAPEWVVQRFSTRTLPESKVLPIAPMGSPPSAGHTTPWPRPGRGRVLWPEARSSESAVPRSHPCTTGTAAPEPKRSDDPPHAPWFVPPTHGASAYPRSRSRRIPCRLHQPEFVSPVSKLNSPEITVTAVGWSVRTRSRHRHPAVHRERLTDDVARPRTAKPQHGRGALLRPARPADRNLLRDLGVRQLVPVDDIAGDLRVDQAGVHCVHAD